MTPGIHVARDGDIATAALANAGKLNALTLAMWKELAQAFVSLPADASLRGVVVRGAGEEAFAAGAPLVARRRKQYVRRLMPLIAPLSQAAINANFDCFKTGDYRIGYQSFLDNTRPKFVGR